MSTFSLQLRSITAVCLLLATGTGLADGVAIQRNATEGAAFSSSIWVGDQLFVAGMLPDDISGNTRAQTTSALLAIKKILQSQGLDMADIIQMRVYLLGDPALGGKMDFAAMNASYSEFFGTASQPNRPVRATVQVAALARAGALVEIEVVAARKASR